MLISDGGSRYHQQELEQLLQLLVDQPQLTLSVLSLPEAVNEQLLTELAAISGGVAQPLAATSDLEALAHRLLTRPSKAAVELVGPGSLHALGQGAYRQLITGKLPAAEHRAALLLDGQPLSLSLEPLPTEPSDAPAALFATAAIERLTLQIKILGETPERRDQVVQLSLAHNVVCEYTALLATETDADYERPTSGRKWQRQTARIGDDLPSTFSSTPEPHEYALLLLGLLLLVVAQRRGWLAQQH